LEVQQWPHQHSHRNHASQRRGGARDCSGAEPYTELPSVVSRWPCHRGGGFDSAIDCSI
jgi:hypothetical protein